MKCPNCKTKEKPESVHDISPETHMAEGSVIEWCPYCGTVWERFIHQDALINIRIPRISEHNPDK